MGFNLDLKAFSEYFISLLSYLHAFEEWRLVKAHVWAAAHPHHGLILCTTKEYNL